MKEPFSWSPKQATTTNNWLGVSVKAFTITCIFFRVKCLPITLDMSFLIYLYVWELIKYFTKNILNKITSCSMIPFFLPALPILLVLKPLCKPVGSCLSRSTWVPEVLLPYGWDPTGPWCGGLDHAPPLHSVFLRGTQPRLQHDSFICFLHLVSWQIQLTASSLYLSDPSLFLWPPTRSCSCDFTCTIMKSIK